MDKVNMIFPSFSNYNCPSPDCVFMAKDKQSFLRHYISKHGLIETFLRETLAERGIAWAPPGLDTTTPSKRQSSEGSTQYIVAQDFSGKTTCSKITHYYFFNLANLISSTRPPNWV